MASIITALLLLLAAGFVYWFVTEPRAKLFRYGVSAVLGILAIIIIGTASFVQVPPSHIGVVSTFGKVDSEVRKEGPHLISPVSKMVPIYLGQWSTAGDKAEDAGSKDLQSVHATLRVLYHVDPARALDLYILNPTLSFGDLIVPPAVSEAFKSVVARYTAEELVTKRREVSDLIMKEVSSKLHPYHLRVDSVNIVNFGFSKAFNAAIEEKVTASQKAETAKRNLERVDYEAKARIAQAEGEAKAIAIQASAVDRQGGAGYVQLQAIEKWDGKLPAYMGGGAPLPFINVK